MSESKSTGTGGSSTPSTMLIGTVAVAVAFATITGGTYLAVVVHGKKKENKRLSLREQLDQPRSFKFWTTLLSIASCRAAGGDGASTPTVLTLSRVSVPIAVLGKEEQRNAGAMISAEGFVECNLVLQDGIIQNMTFGGEQENVAHGTISKIRSTGPTVVDCHGCILVPCFSDAHTHLVKTQIVPRLRNTTGTMTEALLVEETDSLRWKESGDVLRRMEFALQCALHHGTRAIRTHLDGCASPDINVQNAVYDAFDALRKKYSTEIVVQGVANLWLPLWLQQPLAEQHANRAAEHDGVVLGAYVGNHEKSEAAEAMDVLFGHAQRLGLDCDLHIDETNNPACCATLILIESLSKARKAGYQGKVVLGHVCSLSLQEPPTRDFICKQLALLQVYVVSNPFTNLGLQDRQGSQAPHSLEIPVDVPRTPKWRGLTAIQELRAAGVSVASASDNVRDHWYPYGDYDMLSVWAQGQAMGHLDTAPSEGSWADICTVAPSKAMGLDHFLGQGQVADVVLFPSARRASELFSRPQTDRVILRRGKVHYTMLPDFRSLDDLVEEV